MLKHERKLVDTAFSMLVELHDTTDRSVLPMFNGLVKVGPLTEATYAALERASC